MGRGKRKAPPVKIEEVARDGDKTTYRATFPGPSKQQLSAFAKKTAHSIQTATCDAASRKVEGKPAPVCGCGAVARKDGQMECRGMKSEAWVADLLSGKMMRGDAAPVR